MDLDGESEDDNEPQGDGTQPDGSQVLLDAQVLGPDSEAFVSIVPSPLYATACLRIESIRYCTSLMNAFRLARQLLSLGNKQRFVYESVQVLWGTC